MTHQPNRMHRSILGIKKLPLFLQKRAITWFIGRMVPFIGTANVFFEKMTPEEVVLTLKNRVHVQNHINQVHAAATALLGETATGMVVGMNLPDDKLPLMKTMHINYVRRSSGNLRAVANLNPQELGNMHTQPKGEVVVPLTITDETGTEIVKCEMTWAWITKKKR